MLVAGAGVLLAPLAAHQTVKAPAADRKKEVAKPGEFSARVVDPDGKAVKGAKVYRVAASMMGGPPPRMLAESGAGGRFFLHNRDGGAGTGRFPPMWLAVAPGFGPAMVVAQAPAAGQEVTFRLVKDDVPIAGRIVSLEGRPVAGVTVQPFQLAVSSGEDLGPWLKAVAADKVEAMERYFPRQVQTLAGIPGLPARVTTDASGRFRLTGIGRERLVALMVSSPKIESDLFFVMTRTGKAIRVPDSPGSPVKFTAHPATFQHTVSPPQPVVGTVRDGRTGKPIAGVQIDLGLGGLLETKTKADGTYRLSSLPSQLSGVGERSIELIALPPADRPYLSAYKAVRRVRRSEPLRVDFSLPLGVWVTGRVTDRRTGKPVRVALEYHPEKVNPALKDFADTQPLRPGRGTVQTKADGSFRIAVLPGRGIIAARASSGAYLPQRSLSDEEARRDFGLLGGFSHNFHAAARIDVKADGAKCDLVVDSGLTLACEVLDPDGKPVRGARVRGLLPTSYWEQRPLAGHGFTLRALDEKSSRWVVVLHPGRRLGAAVDVKAGAKEPFAIRLEATGTITGRLLDPEGRPWPRQVMSIYYDRPGVRFLHNHLPETIHSDDEGRFRVEAVVAGLRYQVNVEGKTPRRTIGSVKTGLVLRPGETRDLGDVKARLFRE
jgi:hypothetical protein